jgi:two-component system cell cycle response regulator CtrA
VTWLGVVTGACRKACPDCGQPLELLSLRKGTTLTKEMFLNHLYGGMDEPELKIIDVFICKLRKKLSLACGGENYIETVWGRGYVLRDPNEEMEAA